MSTMAILALVFGPLGLFTCGITSVAGLILGIIALVKISNSKGALRGTGLAVAGTAISALFIFVLPAMLIPALVAAKAKAQAINCMNNERQLDLAIKMYADQHNNQYPPAATWCDAINNNVLSPNIFKCPTAAPTSRCDYAFNSKLDGIDQSKVSPQTVVLFESDGGWNASGGTELAVNPPRHNHNRTFTIAFADGHVEMVTADRLGTLRWDP